MKLSDVKEAAEIAEMLRQVGRVRPGATYSGAVLEVASPHDGDVNISIPTAWVPEVIAFVRERAKARGRAIGLEV